MKGCRPISNEEIAKVAQSFKGRYRLRDQAFFKLGLKTGFRVAELLSVRLEDVWANGPRASKAGGPIPTGRSMSTVAILFVANFEQHALVHRLPHTNFDR